MPAWARGPLPDKTERRCPVRDGQHLLPRTDGGREHDGAVRLGALFDGPDDLLAGDVEFELLSRDSLPLAVAEARVVDELGQALNGRRVHLVRRVELAIVLGVEG